MLGLRKLASPLQLYKRADRAFGATWGSSWGGPDHWVAVTNGSIGYNATNNLTSFSQLVVVNTALNTQLPVELLSFNVKGISKGTTVMTNYYQEVDENSYSGISYYSLRQIDFDGTISYSEIRAIAGQQTTSNDDLNIAIFPNPVEEHLKIKFNELPVGVSGSKIQLTSLNGQVLQESKHSIASFKLLTINTVSELSAGVYLIRIELGHGKTMVHKFIKL
ncbi:MAG: hypothetical protein ACI976_001940 [Aureispira sp.]|jgi:hypothetical protein